MRRFSGGVSYDMVRLLLIMGTGMQDNFRINGCATCPEFRDHVYRATSAPVSVQLNSSKPSQPERRAT